MNRNILLYFAAAAVVLTSIAMYFVSRETSEEYMTTGEYDIWAETETSSLETVEKDSTDIHTDYKEIQTDYGKTETGKRTDSAHDPVKQQDITQEEYVYLNVNTATKEEFMLLDGVGEVIAGEIVSYREQTGGFNNIEEILNVKGIGEKTFYKIMNHIYVENPVYPALEITEPEQIVTENIQTEIPYSETSAVPENSFREINEPEATEGSVLETASTEIIPIDLNKATADDLEKLPEITPELAESIIDLRTSIMYFSHPYELLYAQGMTEDILIKILKYVYVKNN